MSKFNPFKWRHYQLEIILLCVRWYLTYPLSYRQVAEMVRRVRSCRFASESNSPVNERGLNVHHTTVFHWVQEYGPEIERRCRPHLRPTNDSWRVDETYIKVKGKPKYLYRAVDSAKFRHIWPILYGNQVLVTSKVSPRYWVSPNASRTMMGFQYSL